MKTQLNHFDHAEREHLEAAHTMAKIIKQHHDRLVFHLRYVTVRPDATAAVHHVETLGELGDAVRRLLGWFDSVYNPADPPAEDGSNQAETSQVADPEIPANGTQMPLRGKEGVT